MIVLAINVYQNIAETFSAVSPTLYQQSFQSILSSTGIAAGVGKMGQRRNSYSYTDNTDIKQRQKLSRRLEQTSRLRCVQSFSPKSR